MQITDFDSLINLLKAAPGPRKRIAVVCPEDDHTCEAVQDAINCGIADFVLVGRAEAIAKMNIELSEHATIVDVADKDEAARTAVGMVRRGEADVLMKGLINTDNLLRAVLNKQEGLLPQGRVLSHITVAQTPVRDKLTFFSDAAVIPFPTLEQRKAMLGEMARVIRAFGVETPRIALIHCSEKISPKFPVTEDYVALKEMAAAGDFGSIIVDGPMDVKTAVDAHSAAIKGIDSPINGQADGLMFPDIEAGNAFYKTILFFGNAVNAGMLMGTTAPVVLPSRSDSAQGKLYSLALACLMA